MNNFSIAPWKTSIAFDRTYIRNIKNAQGEIIAQIPDWDEGLTETTANARLMAAAPELLAALRGMLEYFCEAGIDDYSDTETVQAARAAIERATGDQTATA